MNKSNKQIVIAHLYAQEMNIYGDNGNVIVLRDRLERRGYRVEVRQLNVGDKKDLSDVDIVVGGGGQDSGQVKVEKDMQKNSTEFTMASRDGVTMLMICGMYQLFGEYFHTVDGEKLSGISVFNLTTNGGKQRMIGNVCIETEVGEIVGFENHSGQTVLGSDQKSLGTVKKGSGNNTKTNDEGAISNNTFGSYLHGPLLPKNPRFADELLMRMLDRKFGSRELEPLNDELEQKAARHARSLNY